MAQKTILNKIEQLYLHDKYLECLDIIDKNKDLNADGHYYSALIYMNAERSIHGMKGDIKKGINLLHRAIEEGHADAMYEMAEMYYSGFGVKENDKKAVEYYVMASNHGNIMAKFELAGLYYDNPKYPNSNRVVSLYEELQDDEDYRDISLYRLSKILKKGLFGQEKDIDRSNALLAESSELGNINALMDLAYMYFEGVEVEKDLDKALEYAEKAGEEHMLYEEVVEIINGAKNAH